MIDGTIYKAVGKIETPTSSWKSHVFLKIPSLNIWFQLLTYGTSPSVAECVLKNINTNTINVNIRAVKLELGSVSTLSMDTVPNYAEELRKCQRYFQRYKQVKTDTIAIGAVKTTETVRLLFDLTTPMRANPTVTASDTVGDYTNTGLTIQRIGANITLGDGSVAKVQLNARASSSVFTLGQAKNICATSNDFYIDFSADL